MMGPEPHIDAVRLCGGCTIIGGEISRMRPPHSTTVNRQKLQRLENHRAETITHCSSAKTNMQYGFGMVISGSPADPGRQNQRTCAVCFESPSSRRTFEQFAMQARLTDNNRGSDSRMAHEEKDRAYPRFNERQSILFARRSLKMARSAHAYVRGNTRKFYEWLADADIEKIPRGPAVWICGDCHVGNLGPIADAKGRIDIQIRDLDQTVIGNPAHDLIRLGLSLC